MIFVVVDLSGNPLAECDSIYSLDRFLVDQVKAGLLSIGQFRVIERESNSLTHQDFQKIGDTLEG